jgi:hypothetical protein
MKKTIPWAITWFMAVMLLFSINSWAQLFETDFGVSTNWDPDNSNTAYETRSYSDGVWTFTGESTIRDNIDTYNGSAHTFRNRGLFTITNTEAVAEIDGFTLYIRDWSVTSDRIVRVSTNGGTDFTEIVTINSGWFTNQDDYFPLTHNFPSTTDLNANDLVIEITGAGDNSTRMRIGGFVALGELPAYTTLFEFSNANANLGDLAWFNNYRNFAADANNLYFGKPDLIDVVDRFTGVKTGVLNTTGITGGWRSINDIEVSSDGLLFAANGILGVGDNFKVYHVSTDPLVEPVNVIDFDFSTIFSSTRLGDRFTVVGRADDGSLAIYAAESDGGSPARIIKWLINSAPGEPISFGNPIVINIAQKGSGNQVAPLPNGNFYHTGAGISINKYDEQGSLLGSIPGSVVPTGSTAIKYIGMDGKDEMLAVYHYGSSDGYLRLVRVVDGVAGNAVLEFSTPQLGPNNSAGNGDVAFVPNEDGTNVDLYVMDGSDGFGGYSTNNLDIEFPTYLPPADPVYARAQIIHNSADPAAASVDVFVNGELFYGDLNFREATPFVDVPAGINLTVDIAPAGAGIGASVFNLPDVQFVEDETYIVVASGIVSDAGFTPLTPFTLELFTGAREAAEVATDVDLLVYHGVTDAPGVNVDARYVGNLVSNAEYAGFAGYLNVPAAYYTLDIAAFAAPDNVLVSFGADLRALEGGAATVIASGFLDPSVNSDGAGFALLAVLADGTVVELPVAMDYEFDLSGLVEVPSNFSNGIGSGVLTLAGTVAQLSGSFSGLGSAYTMSHIHIAAAGSNGGVAHALTAELDGDELGGSYNPDANIFDFSQENIDQLTDGELYVNIHSTDYPAGEIRGQILPSPNAAPTASAITVPANGAAITIAGDPATPFVPEWDAATDDDGNMLAYVWQLAADEAFTTILVNASTGTETQFETDFGTVNTILEGAGVAPGASITVYHRAVSTDGSAITFGNPSSVVLTAGLPELTAEPEMLNVGYAVNGMTSTSAVVTITNSGYAPAEIADGEITLAGTNAADFTFSLVDDQITYPITLNSGEEFDVEVTYTPTSVVEAAAQLVIASTAAEDLTIELMAVGYDPLTQFFDDFNEYDAGVNPTPWNAYVETAGPGSFVDFSTAGTPVSEPRHSRIANGNNATGEVMLISPMVTDLDVSWIRFFSRMGSSSQVEDLQVGYITDPEDPSTFVPVNTLSVSGSYQQYVVSFADVDDPSLLPETAYIAFRHTFPANFRIYLIDDVTYEPVPSTAILSVDKNEVNFGDAVYLDQTVTQNVLVTNTGVGTLTLNEADFTITGADAANFGLIFTDDVTLPVELGTAESYNLTISFTPDAVTGYAATLEIEDNLLKAITTVTLTGTGYDPTITPEFVYDFTGDFPPLDWANLQGILTDNSQLTPGTFWQHDEFTNDENLPENNSAKINIYSERYGWLVTPPVDLGDGTTPYMLSFDMGLTEWNNSNPGTLENKRIAVVISTDNGVTWSDANILREWVDGDVISHEGQKETIDLSAYSGIVKIGFYAESTLKPSDVELFITNVGIEEAVYQTVTFNVTDVADVTITDATVTFNGEVLTAAPYEFVTVAGTYPYEVSKDGYQIVNGSATIADVNVDVDVVLEELFAVDFTVTDFDLTALAGADIAISGDASLMLTTDAAGLASVELIDGTYQAVVSMMGYMDETIDILIDGAPLAFEVELADMAAAPYNLMVDVAGQDALFSWNNPVLTESFEEGEMPEGWTQIIENTGSDINIGDFTWQITGAVELQSSTITPQDGDYQAFIMWSNDAQDEWLITPEFEAPDGNLIFWYHGTNGSTYGDNYYVKVSTDDGASWTALWNASDLPAGENHYDVPATVDLSAYAGQNIKIAWNGVDGDGQGLWYTWAIDNITIGGKPFSVKDLAFESASNLSSGAINPMAKDGLYRNRVKVADMVNLAADKAFTGYTVFLNGTEMANDVTETEYSFTNLPYGTHTAGVAANYSSGNSDTVYTDFTIQLPAVDPIPMAILYDATGDNLPAEIGTGSNARSAALYQDRYVIVPSREGGPQVWAFDMINPHLDPIALDMGTDLIVGGLFPVNYVEVVGDDIYVSNMSLGSDANHPFRVYRWSSLDAAPELVLSSDGGWGRLGDAFTIIGDPAADGSIVAHINSDPGENPLRRKFRKFDFAGGVIQNEDAPELVEVTLPDGVGTMNSYGVMKLIEGETDKFLVTSNAIGMAIVDGSGANLAYIGTDVFPSRTMDANIFYFGGNRYLSFVVNKEWETLNGNFTAAYYQVVDISLGATVEEAISLISTPQDLINRTVHTAAIGDGSAFLGGTNRVVVSGDNLLVLSHVVARGFKLVTSGAAMEAYTLTVEAAPAESGTVTGGGDFFEGATVPVTATPADDYQFVNWTVGGTEVSTDAEFDYTMPGEVTTLVANFEPIPVTDVATLAELRDLPSDGSRYRYTGNAVIVAMDGFRNRKFLQDETAAIMIDDNGGTITTEYDLYDEITNVTGFTTVFRNLLQFVPLENTPESTVNTPVDPAVFTLDAVTQDDQAKYIKFMNVSFVGVEPDSLFANGTNYTVTDGTNNFVVRTDFWNTDLFNTEIPTGPVNISGVVITFNETLQLVPRFLADIEAIYTLTLVANPAEGGTVSGEGSYAEGTMVSLNATAAEGYVFKDWTNAGGTVVSTEAAFDYSMPAEATTLTANFDIVDNVENLGIAFNIFPNPARDNFTIRSGATIRTLVISDITGKVVYNDVVNDTEIRIQNEFETGIYILHIHTDEGIAVRKLQIQK